MLLIQTTFLVGLTVVVAKLADTGFLSNESLSKNLTLRCFCSCGVLVESSKICCWFKRLVVVRGVGAVVEVAVVVEVKESSSGVWEGKLEEVVSSGALVVTGALLVVVSWAVGVSSDDATVDVVAVVNAVDLIFACC